MANGNAGAIVNRVLQWGALAGVFVYVLNIGQWVGAADEKFKDAETVEQRQEDIRTDVNTIANEQSHIQQDISDIKAEQASQGEQLDAQDRKLDAILRKLEE